MKKLAIAILATVMILAIGFSSFAQSVSNTVNVIFNKIVLEVNGTKVLSDNILYNDTTYVPLRAVSEMFAKKIFWNPKTYTADIVDKSKYQIQGFYAISSFEGLNKMYQDKSLCRMNNINMAWAKLEYNNGELVLNTSPSKGNDFYIPEEYYKSLIIVKSLNIPIGLSIYAEDNYQEIFSNSEFVCEEIVNLINNPNYIFNGVIIDFEQLPEEYSQKFVKFLKDLKSVLDDKTLSVAVHPPKWARAYDYKEIANISDNVILMAHDFDPKSLDSNYIIKDIVYTPQAPIEDVINSIKSVIELGVDSNKILLQLSFGTVQWKYSQGKLIDNYDDGIIYPNTPSYDLIYKRINSELDKGRKIDEIISYDNISQAPYIKYYNEEDKTDNVIWYEDERSIMKKLDLVKEYELGGVSLWRIGNIPNFKDGYLSIWDEIKKLE